MPAPLVPMLMAMVVLGVSTTLFLREYAPPPPPAPPLPPEPPFPPLPVFTPALPGAPAAAADHLNLVVSAVPVGRNGPAGARRQDNGLGCHHHAGLVGEAAAECACAAASARLRHRGTGLR